MSYEILPYINILFSGHKHDVHNIILLPKLVFQKTKNVYSQNKESLFSMFFVEKWHPENAVRGTDEDGSHLQSATGLGGGCGC